jgi:hypothetical protein
VTIYCPICDSAKVYRVNLVDKTVYDNIRRFDPKNPQNSLVRINEDGYYGSEPGPPAPQITAGYCSECSSLWAPLSARGFSTIELGPTITLSPNESASVTNVGDNVNAILSFSIPRGETGIQGPVGPVGPQGAVGPPGSTAGVSEVGVIPSTTIDTIAIANVVNVLQWRLENNGDVYTFAATDRTQAYNRAQRVASVGLTDGATIATDASLSNVFTVTLAGNRTLGAPTNLGAGGTYLWIISQDSTGSRTLAYNSVFKFPAGSLPTLSTAANAVDALTCVHNGSILLCSLTKDFR